MLKYIEAIQHRAKVMAQYAIYSKADLEHGLDSGEDIAVAHILVAIYGREYCEVEHDLIVYADIYQS